MEVIASQGVLETYKKVRRRFFDAGDSIFGPGVMSMAEHYFTRKIGKNPFSMIFSEPKIVYQEWINQFKGDKVVGRLIEVAVGPDYLRFIDNMRRNDALQAWSFLERLVSREQPYSWNQDSIDSMAGNKKVRLGGAT